MWNFLIISVMLAATGVYTSDVERNYGVAKQAASRATAENMALYRAAVVQYFTVHDKTNFSASANQLKSFLPSWFTPNAASTGVTWKNYRDASGVIYIFPMASEEETQSTSIVNEVVEVSQNSSLVGVYRASDSTLYYPVDGARIPTASLSTQPIADGAPVWIATRG